MHSTGCRTLAIVALLMGVFGGTTIYAQGLPDIVVEQPAGNSLTNGISTVDFGAVVVGANLARDFAIRNSGTADLASLSVEIEQPDVHFSVTLNPHSPLAPGGSTTFTVTFAPNSSGTKTNGLLIRSNVAGSPGRFQVILSGVASGPTATPTPTLVPPTPTPTMTPTPTNTPTPVPPTPTMVNTPTPLPTSTPLPTPSPTNTPPPTATPTPTPVFPPTFGLTVAFDGVGDAEISFVTEPGRKYLVQFNDDLIVNWNNLTTITASPGQYSVLVIDIEASLNPERFYRVLDVTGPNFSPLPTPTPTPTPIP